MKIRPIVAKLKPYTLRERISGEANRALELMMLKLHEESGYLPTKAEFLERLIEQVAKSDAETMRYITEHLDMWKPLDEQRVVEEQPMVKPRKQKVQPVVNGSTHEETSPLN